MPIRSPEVLLAEASARLDNADVVGGACFAREALRRHLRSLCDLHGCRPAGRDQTPRALTKALYAAGVLTDSRRRRYNRLAQTCHRSAHLLQVRPNKMRRTIESIGRVVSGVVVC